MEDVDLDLWAKAELDFICRKAVDINLWRLEFENQSVKRLFTDAIVRIPQMISIKELVIDGTMQGVNLINQSLNNFQVA